MTAYKAKKIWKMMEADGKMFGLFKKKDLICGMKEEKGKGISDAKSGNWFCSENCKNQFQKNAEIAKKPKEHGSSCCH